jgi:lantibiotic modifying enzyme
MPLAGFSHGNAGIALSLLRLAAATGEKRFQEAALAALEYERSIFSPERNNWPDLRETPVQPDLDSTQSYRYMTAWCHGAPGIALARIASLQFHADATIRAEIEAAVQTTLKEGFGSNHSLCHGDMGNLEVLLLAGRLFPDRYAGVRETIQSMLLESIQTCGWQSGIPYPMETPGLMLGLAGTGYALLRQFAPEQIPSVLVLDAPNPG